jgi:hypothetical protein
MMKNLIKVFLVACLITGFAFSVNAQIAITTDGSDPNGSAMLDVKSTSKGFLAPRMTAAEKGAITNPTIGLLIYQTDDTAGFYYYTGAAWVAIPSGGGSDISFINLPFAPNWTYEISNFGTAKTNYLILDFQDGGTNDNTFITLHLPAAASFSACSIIQVYVNANTSLGGSSDVYTYVEGKVGDSFKDLVSESYSGAPIELSNTMTMMYDELSNTNSFKIVSDANHT